MSNVQKKAIDINELDSMFMLHDKFYNENSDTKVRNISDIAL